MTLTLLFWLGVYLIGVQLTLHGFGIEPGFMANAGVGVLSYAAAEITDAVVD